MKKKRILALLAALAMYIGCFAGCGEKEAANDGIGAEVKLNGDAVYPVECEDTLTYWMILNPPILSFAENFAETPLAKEMEKLSGIKVEYIHPQTGQESEQLNIMMATNDLPDMVQHSWNLYSGGPDKAIADDIIIPLNEPMKKFAPEMYKIYSEDEDVVRDLTTDSGNYYTVSIINEDQWTHNASGWIIRRDWLDKAGLDVPKSFAELEKMVYKFKEYSTGEPFFLDPYYRNEFLNMFNVGGSSDVDFYVEEGVVKYGPVQPGFKDAVETLKKWKNDGILDQNYTSGRDDYQTAAILNGKTGLFLGAPVGGIGMRLDAKPTEVPEFDLQGIPFVNITGDEYTPFGGRRAYVSPESGTAVSANCKNIELAMRYLNFGFTEEGRKLNNYGIEGKTYEIVDGEVKFTEFLTNNPDGYTISEIAPMYMRSSYGGPFVKDDIYVKASLRYPAQVEAYQNWSKASNESVFPDAATVAVDNLDRAAEIQTNLTTYVDEMFVKFINGTEPIENIDKYYEQLYKYDLEELLQYKQEAYDRYMKK